MASTAQKLIMEEATPMMMFKKEVRTGRQLQDVLVLEAEKLNSHMTEPRMQSTGMFSHTQRPERRVHFHGGPHRRNCDDVGAPPPSLWKGLSTGPHNIRQGPPPRRLQSYKI